LTTVFRSVAGKPLVFSPLTGTTDTPPPLVSRVQKGDVTPLEKNFAKSCGKHEKNK
jgi:hypothetical protein